MKLLELAVRTFCDIRADTIADIESASIRKKETLPTNRMCWTI